MAFGDRTARWDVPGWWPDGRRCSISEARPRAPAHRWRTVSAARLHAVHFTSGITCQGQIGLGRPRDQTGHGADRPPRRDTVSPLDDQEFAPIYNCMAEQDLPVRIHPARGADTPDCPANDRSKCEIWWTTGLPHETSAAMLRPVYSTSFDRLPGLKIMNHHGGRIPFFEGRLGPGNDVHGAGISGEQHAALRAELRSVIQRLLRPDPHEFPHRPLPLQT